MDERFDEKHIEKSLENLREELPINHELKWRLRKQFSQGKKGSWRKKVYVAAAAMAAVASLVAISLLVTPEKVIERANAASLKIANHLSFVEIGGGNPLGVSEHAGKIYMPVAGKGIFAYGKDGFSQLIKEGDANHVSVSPDGKQLAFSSKGSIKIADLESGSTRTVLEGGRDDIYFEEPVWSADGQTLLFTKKTAALQEPHGVVEKNELYLMVLKTKKQQKICEGSHGYFLKGTESIVFERNQEIIYRNIKEGTEKIMDQGRFPSVSPDGAYVAYVKAEETKRQAAPKAEVMETIDNVWIADAVDFKTKKQVTSNYPDPFIDEKEWIKTLKPSDVTQVLNITGRYSYYEPVWSSDSGSIYLLKNLNQESGGGMKLARVDFVTQKPSPEATVKRFLQALVVRDEDFAKSIMKNPPELLTVSNPRQVGFKILGQGKEGEKQYVDAEVNSAYTANPYYASAKVRFYLEEGLNGYVIDQVKDIDSVTVTARDDVGAVYIERGEEQDILFRDSDIPTQFGIQGKHRFASMAYNQAANTLVFTVQMLQEEQQKASVHLISYDLKTKEFKQIDHITEIKNQVNIGVENLIIDSKGEFAALDLFSDDDAAYRSHICLYSLKDGKRVDAEGLFGSTSIDASHTVYWDDGRLLFTTNSFDQSMKYVYAPADKSISSY